MAEALQVQTATIQLQVDTQEWMGNQAEQLVQAMDLQQDVQEVLALALLHLSSHIRAWLGQKRRSELGSE